MSNKIALIESLLNCIDPSQNDVSFDGRFIQFYLQNLGKDDFSNICTELNIKYEEVYNKRYKIRIDLPLSDNDLFFFYDEDDFVKRSIAYLNEFDSSHFVILKTDNGSKQKFPFETFTPNKALLFNFFQYNEILTFLKAAEHFVAIDYRDKLQFIIFSSEKGPFYVGYNPHELRIKNLENLEPICKDLIEDFKKTDFVQFFKSALINAIQQYSIEERFFYLIQSLRVILNVAERDHFIYIRNFDFEKIRKKFNEGKNKYFDSLEKSIDSISKQVTSFPLTFAASIFAGYQVKEKPTILILVFIAYALYTFIAWQILTITSYNTQNVKDDVEAEKNKIKNDYNLLYKDFKKDFKAISNKIKKIEFLIFTLRIVLISLIVCFLVFSIYQFRQNSSLVLNKTDPVKIRQNDSILNDKFLITNINAALGNPSIATSDTSNANNYLIIKPQYITSYNNSKGTPNWVSWNLNSSWIGRQKRADFKIDSSLPSYFNFISKKDYNNYQFDRGHLCPSKDRTDNEEDNNATFLMTNIAPQNPNFNKGVWKNLEAFCQNLALSGDNLFIIDGVFGKGGYNEKQIRKEYINNGRVTVPEHFWKIILILTPGQEINSTDSSTRVIAVDILNKNYKAKTDWRNFRVSVDSLESLTNYDFFSTFSEKIQKELEKKVDYQ